MTGLILYFAVIIIVVMLIPFVFISEKTISRPKNLFIIGSSVCVLAAWLKLLMQGFEIDSFLLKTLADFLSTAVAAMGGGLIASSALMLAQIKHNQGLKKLAL